MWFTPKKANLGLFLFSYTKVIHLELQHKTNEPKNGQVAAVREFKFFERPLVFQQFSFFSGKLCDVQQFFQKIGQKVQKCIFQKPMKYHKSFCFSNNEVSLCCIMRVFPKKCIFEKLQSCFRTVTLFGSVQL